MAFEPVICRGTPEVNGTDVSAQVMEIIFRGSRDSVAVPATFGTRMSYKAGNDTYEVTIRFLQDVDAASISDILFQALGDADGTITVAGTVRPGAASPNNKKYTGTAVVTGWNLGGEVNTVLVDSVTFPLTDRPAEDDGS